MAKAALKTKTAPAKTKGKKPAKLQARRPLRQSRPATEHPASFYLGKQVREGAGGVSGVCTIVSLQPSGSWMIAIQPKAGRDGQAVVSHMFDEPLIEVLGAGVSDRLPKPDLSPRFERGDWVEHLVAPITGLVIAQSWHINGCVTYSVVPAHLSERGRSVTEVFLGNELKAAPGRTRMKEFVIAPEAATGGPPMRAVSRVV